MNSYTARWAQPGQTSIANVSFEARSDYHAKKSANKIARDLGVTRTPRTITKDATLIECIQTGVS